MAPALGLIVYFASVFTLSIARSPNPTAPNAATYNFDDSSGLGRRFDGIGGLSGGGATSKLLVNYPEKERNEILDYLFKPNFGASLQILKVEIGGDAQSTDGTEASHMHNSWDENYQRGYEWWLMVEAKKRNPGIKLYGLPWGFPGWIGQGARNPYTNPNVTADYVVRWVNGAKVHYNLTIDFVGIWNERPYNITYIKTLRKMLDARGFSSTRIVAADSSWSIAVDIMNYPELSAAVDYIGCHYPGTKTSVWAVMTGKQLWSSEDYSTYNDEVGGGCWARILNKNYAVGNMTATISWNLIASYYSHLPYYRDGLMTAVEPWSGNYNVDSPIWLSAHTTQFTEIGWKYLQHGSGVGILEHGGSYVALVSPDGKDLTIIVETMSHNHSKCIRPALPEYDVQPQTMNIQLRGAFGNIPELNVWYSKLGFDGQSSILFEKKDPLKLKNGIGSLSLGLDEVHTLTTLTRGQKGQYAPPPQSAPFPLPYSDNFETYAISEEPYNLAQQTGSYEIVASSDATHGHVARQMVLQTSVYWCQADIVNKSINLIDYPLFTEPYNLAPQIGSFEVVKSANITHGQTMRQTVIDNPLEWCPINLVFPITLGGNSNWSDIFVEVEVDISPVNGTDGVFVAARVQKGGCNSYASMGIFFFLFPQKQTYSVTYDLARTRPLTSGSVTAEKAGWNKLSLLVQGSVVQGTLNGKSVFKVQAPKATKNGFVAMGTDNYGLADFDNFRVTSVSDGLQILKDYELSAPGKASDTLYFKSENH